MMRAAKSPSILTSIPLKKLNQRTRLIKVLPIQPLTGGRQSLHTVLDLVHKEVSVDDAQQSHEAEEPVEIT